MELTNNPTEEIPCFTLAQLLSMQGASPERELAKGCMTATNNLQRRLFRYPCRIDALFIGVCTEGEAEISFNLNNFRLSKDSMFIYAPKNIIQVHSDERFCAHMVIITPEFMQRLNVDIKRMMPLFLRYANRPCIELSEEECRTFRSFLSQVEQELAAPDTPFSRDVVDALVTATIYKSCDNF